MLLECATSRGKKPTGHGPNLIKTETILMPSLLLNLDKRGGQLTSSEGGGICGEPSVRGHLWGTVMRGEISADHQCLR